MLGDKGFVAILGAVMTVIYTSFLVVAAVCLICVGLWKTGQLLWQKARRAWTQA